MQPDNRNDVITKIDDSTRDPLGAMLLAYMSGDRGAFLEVDSTSLEMSTMEASLMFREYSRMSELERSALDLCCGRTLDVGAGSGCHSLYLQQQGIDVEAVDVSPGCVQVMRARGVRKARHRNLFSVTGMKYDTILMLMNGLGICGTLSGLEYFMRHVQTLLADGGQILADTTDLAPLYELSEVKAMPDVYYGETEFVMRYEDRVSDPFPWLYVDFSTLSAIAGGYGLQCEQLLAGEDGQYLVRICR